MMHSIFAVMLSWFRRRRRPRPTPDARLRHEREDAPPGPSYQWCRESQGWFRPLTAEEHREDLAEIEERQRARRGADPDPWLTSRRRP
jgi:hypothetical protein